MIQALKGLQQYSKRHKWQFYGAAFLTLLFSALALIDPYISGMLIDSILEGDNRSFVIMGIALLVGSTIIRGILRFIYFMMFERISQDIVYELRQDMYKKLQSLDFKFFDKTRTGQLLSKMTGDTEAIRHFYAWVIHMSIFNITVFFFALIAMFFINIPLTLILLLIIPAIVFLSSKLSKSVRPNFIKVREQFSRLNTVVQENISGNRVVKAYAKECYEMEKFEKENMGYRNINLESAKIWEKYMPILDTVGIVFNAILLLVGGLMIMKGTLTIGELVAFNRFLWMISHPMRMVGNILNDSQRFSTSYQKIHELFLEESDIEVLKQPTTLERVKGYIRFEHVSFQYQNMPVLKDISFDIKPGQTVAIIGSTGSGKSTLTHLISRFYDATEGTIYIDDLPIKQLDLMRLRQSISVAMQDIFLFSDTIEGNITYGVPDASMEQVEWASRVAGITDFVYELEEGYNTIIGERGVGLSGGQKQRIALARALIQNPTILILDDTTSAVDMETEYRILSELKKVNQDRTTFIIAHRISSVKDADLILVLNEGAVIERGSHQVLMDQKGYYYQVFTQQMGEFDVKVEVL